MATTTLLQRHAGEGETIAEAIRDCLDYGKNPEKTESGKYISAYELVRHGGRITFISGDILSAFCFLRVLAIVQTIPDSLSNRFAFARMAL